MQVHHLCLRLFVDRPGGGRVLRPGHGPEQQPGLVGLQWLGWRGQGQGHQVLPSSRKQEDKNVAIQCEEGNEGEPAHNSCALLVPRFSYYILLFPALDVASAFPLNAITLVSHRVRPNGLD